MKGERNSPAVIVQNNCRLLSSIKQALSLGENLWSNCIEEK